MEILHQDFHEDDAYNRDCTAFKVRTEALLVLDVLSFPLFQLRCDWLHWLIVLRAFPVAMMTLSAGSPSMQRSDSCCCCACVVLASH